MGARHQLVAALALSLSGGCQRGCLATWLAEHSVAGADPVRDRSASPWGGGSSPRGSTAAGSSPRGLDLGGVDCVSGLARCRAGRVEVSTAGQIPSPCTAPKEHPEACTCPWEEAGTCASSCVEDDLEIVAAPDVAATQLCATGALLLRPPSPAESASVTICADETVTCEAGVVRACRHRGQTAAIVGACVHGCASHVALEPEDLFAPLGPGSAGGDTLRAPGVAAILCRRDQAERR